ncbi:MAG: S8 family peptidase [Candidatus Kariarchaeaceae archaeon]|jgi:subtilisin family serine protease
MRNKLLPFLMLIIILLIPTGSFASSYTTLRSLEFQGTPVNFQDYPDAFGANSIMPWNLDMIDIENVNDEHPEITGEGVYIAVLDTGLKKNWRDYFPEERIVTEWGRSFVDVGVMSAIKTGIYKPNVVESRDFKGEDPHGTHVTSTIIGFSLFGNPIQGVAPNANIIPVKVLNTYEGIGDNFGTDYSVAAGIEYVTSLALANPGSRFVISMSLGALAPISQVEKSAIDNAIAAGVIVVAAAGNYGTDGMDSPGSYEPVISVGSSGWALDFATGNGEWAVDWSISQGFWTADVPEDNVANSYISEFSGRERPDMWTQELDVVAPGSWVVGPYPVGPGQSHLPNWANGYGNGVGGQYYFVGGTSMATPHVSGIVALMLQANPSLMQADVESILRGTADTLPFAGVQAVVDPDFGLLWIEWGFDGWDAVGWGLAQADTAVNGAFA